jgi:hypothetical protein
MTEPLLTHETFSPHVGQPFELAPPAGEPFEAVLTSCDASPHEVPDEWREDVGRVPFSLVFDAAAATTLVPQQIFSVRHPEAGEFEIFLVPLGPIPDGGIRYEAVFS